jgi:retron-type reverse transcriptase
MPTSQVKPFDIPKQMVWEAYRRVAANEGAPGVDEETLDEFESDLKNNLFTIWNRMSSGSFFPPPVRAVEISTARAVRPMEVGPCLLTD